MRIQINTLAKILILLWIFLTGLTAAHFAYAAKPVAVDEQRREVQQLVVSQARKNGVVPPALALAVAKVESDFQPLVRSYAGARGVMQIMPQTARGEFGIAADDLWDARLNIRTGIDYLERLYRMYGNRWDLALSHYNGGTLRKIGHAFVPHAYTRNYVNRVTTWWRRYERAQVVALLSGSASRDATRFRTPTFTRTAPHVDEPWTAESPATNRGWRFYLDAADHWLGARSDNRTYFDPELVARLDRCDCASDQRAAQKRFR